MTDALDQGVADEARAGAPGRGHAQAAEPAAPSALRGLLDVLRDWSDEREALAAASGAGLPAAGEWPALPALAGFQGLWSELRNREQLRRVLAPAPADAGPLNSRALVHRMLGRMQAQSPGYLRHFMAYVDMLAELEALQAHSAPEASEVQVKGRKRAARAARAASR